MKLAKFDEPLEKYVESLSLSSTQDKLIASALETILSLVLGVYPEAEVYAQGSFSTDTMAKPLTANQGNGSAGEYDIDIAIEREGWDAAVDALESVTQLIEEDGIYGQMTIDKTKNSCVRIVYAPDSNGVGFHIDLVPTKFENDSRFAPYRKNNSWKSSDTKKSADWFNSLTKKQPELRSIVLILKRLRDLASLGINLKSVLVLTLVANSYYSNGSLMGDLLAVLGEINELFANDQQAPFIKNPVNPGENLTETLDDYSTARKFFIDTEQQLRDAITEDDAAALKELFGPGFTYVAERQKTIPVPTTIKIQEPVRAYGVSNATSNQE